MMLEFALLIGLATAITVPGFMALREQRKLLRQIRKVAEKYPPYVPASADLDTEDQSRVEVAKDWDEEISGRD